MLILHECARAGLLRNCFTASSTYLANRGRAVSLQGTLLLLGSRLRSEEISPSNPWCGVGRNECAPCECLCFRGSSIMSLVSMKRSCRFHLRRGGSTGLAGKLPSDGNTIPRHCELARAVTQRIGNSKTKAIRVLFIGQWLCHSCQHLFLDGFCRSDQIGGPSTLPF